MGRQFIAVAPVALKENQDLKNLLAKFKRTVDGRKQEARWVPPDLWHVTLAFLGDLSAEESERAKSMIKRLDDLASGTELRLHGLGAFPSVEQGRVLWVGVQETQSLLNLRERIREELRAEKLHTDDRDDRPHLTLARFRNVSNLDHLVKLGGRKKFGDYMVGEVILFESVLQGNIVKYVPVARSRNQ
jgi:RNA 2',3'-cyclic 3'-phosphodiesterase